MGVGVASLAVHHYVPIVLVLLVQERQPMERRRVGTRAPERTVSVAISFVLVGR